MMPELVCLFFAIIFSFDAQVAASASAPVGYAQTYSGAAWTVKGGYYQGITVPVNSISKLGGGASKLYYAPLYSIFSVRELRWLLQSTVPATAHSDAVITTATVFAAPYYYLAQVTCCDTTGVVLMANGAPVKVFVFLALAYDYTQGWKDLSGVQWSADGSMLLWTCDPTKTSVVVDTLLRSFALSVVTDAQPIAELGGATLSCWPLQALDLQLLLMSDSYFSSTTSLSNVVAQVQEGIYADPAVAVSTTSVSGSFTWPVPVSWQTAPASSDTLPLTFSGGGQLNVPQGCFYSALPLPGGQIPQTYVAISAIDPGASGAPSFLPFVVDTITITPQTWYVDVNAGGGLNELWLAVTPTHDATSGAITSFAAAADFSYDAGRKQIVCSTLPRNYSSKGGPMIWATSSSSGRSSVAAQQAQNIQNIVAGKHDPSLVSPIVQGMMTHFSGVIACSGVFFQGQMQSVLVPFTSGTQPILTPEQVQQNPNNLMLLANYAAFGNNGKPAPSLLFANPGTVIGAQTGLVSSMYTSPQLPSNAMQPWLSIWQRVSWLVGGLVCVGFESGASLLTGLLALGPWIDPFVPYFHPSFAEYMHLLYIDSAQNVVPVANTLSGTKITGLATGDSLVGSGLSSSAYQAMVLAQEEINKFWRVTGVPSYATLASAAPASGATSSGATSSGGLSLGAQAATVLSAATATSTKKSSKGIPVLSTIAQWAKDAANAIGHGTVTAANAVGSAGKIAVDAIGSASKTAANAVGQGTVVAANAVGAAGKALGNDLAGSNTNALITTGVGAGLVGALGAYSAYQYRANKIAETTSNAGYNERTLDDTLYQR